MTTKTVNRESVIDLVLRYRLGQRLHGAVWHGSGQLPPEREIVEMARQEARAFYRDDDDISAAVERLLNG
jgi:hypothetical protein